MNLADEPGTKRTCGLRLKSDSFTFNNWLCWMRSFIHQCVSERSRWLYCCGISLWSRGLLPPRPLQLPQTLERPHADVQSRVHLLQVRFSDQRQATDSEVRVERVWGADGSDRRETETTDQWHSSTPAADTRHNTPTEWQHSTVSLRAHE